MDWTDILPSNYWFDAAVLFDVYCERKAAHSRRMNFANLPATCLALVRLLSKNDNATVLMCDDTYIEYTNQLLLWLQKRGYVDGGPDVTEDDADMMELELLKALKWQLNVSTPESWVAKWCARVNVYTRNRHRASLAWIREYNVDVARIVVLRKAQSSQLPPRLIACGLFSLGFVMAGIIPARLLQPLKGNEWTLQLTHVLGQLVGNGPCAAVSGVRDLEAPPSTQCMEPDCMLQLLEVSTGCSASELIEACSAVMGILLEIFPQSLSLAPQMQRDDEATDDGQDAEADTSGSATFPCGSHHISNRVSPVSAADSD
jgi:hypothetical protein